MNCQGVISKMGFVCRDLGEDMLRVWSPFTYGNDGERVGLYVEKTFSGYRVSDNCEALMHASSMGINLTESKINAVRRSTGFEVSVSDGGEISAFVPEDQIGKAVASVLSASLAVSHLEGHWVPKTKADSFTKIVGAVLEASLGEKVQRNVNVIGASGHQIEFPFGVRADDSMIYIQPIATAADNKVDWKAVYTTFGRMTDIKRAEIHGASRMVVMQDAANDSEMKRAIVLLTDTASVVNYTNLRAWSEKMAA